MFRCYCASFLDCFTVLSFRYLMIVVSIASVLVLFVVTIALFFFVFSMTSSLLYFLHILSFLLHVTCVEDLSETTSLPSHGRGKAVYTPLLSKNITIFYKIKISTPKSNFQHQFCPYIYAVYVSRIKSQLNKSEFLSLCTILSE